MSWAPPFATPTSDATPAAAVASSTHRTDTPEEVASFDYCRQVVRRRAGNFHLGLKLTPEPRRSALYALYAWMRAADDVADGRGSSREKGLRLAGFRLATARALGVSGLGSAPDDPPADLAAPEAEVLGGVDPRLWPAFRRAVSDHALDPSLLAAMLDGQASDLGPVHMDDFEQLHRYCWRVAGTVGLLCVRVWGHEDEWAQVAPLAEARGVAMQLTNILRDVREDAHRDRCYLPAQDLERFGLTRLDPSGATPVDGEALAWRDLIHLQVGRAQNLFDASAELEDRLDPACRSTCRALTRVYRRLLEMIEQDPLRVLRGRVSLPRREKIRIALAAAAGR